jgi:hypothetical protein
MNDKSTVDASQKGAANYNAYIRLRDNGHSDWVKAANLYTNFYLGHQWSEEDKKKLDEEGRPAITVNAVLSTINTLIGEMVQNQPDVQFKPLRGGSEEKAARLNAIFQHVSHDCQYQFIEQQLFADGIIEDRGFLDIRMDFTKSILGEISIDLEDATQVLIDNNASSRDPDTWSEVIITRWLTLDEVEQIYGAGKREEIAMSCQVVGVLGDDSVEHIQDRRFGDDDGAYSLGSDADGFPEVNRVRIIERQYFKLKKAKCLIDPVTGDIRDIPDTFSQERIDALVSQYGFYEAEMPRRKVYMTVTADRVVLHDGWSPYRTYTIVPYFPYFRRGKPLGVVANLVSVQELLNKTTSQELHIVNSTANSGWLLEENSLSNMTEDELVENGSKTGIVLVYRRGIGNKPEKIQPNNMPHGIDRISMKASSSLREISGVNAAMSGAVNAHQVSGVAVREQTQRGRVQAVVPDEALKWTRHRVALKVLELVQDFYTEGRIVYVADPLDPSKGRQPIAINEQDENGAIPHDVTVGRYDVVIGTMPTRDTADEIEFAQLLQMKAEGIQIPDHFIINRSSIANRKELATFVMDLQGFGELTPEQQQQQQLEMELQQQMVEAELGKLQATAEELRTRAGFNSARADSLAGHNLAAIELAKVEADIMKKERELQLRSQLAGLSYNGQMQQNRSNNATKMALGVMQSRNQQDSKKPTPQRKS